MKLEGNDGGFIFLLFCSSLTVREKGGKAIVGFLSKQRQSSLHGRGFEIIFG